MSSLDTCVVCAGTVGELVLGDLRDIEYQADWAGEIRACDQCKLVQQAPMLSVEEAIAYYPPVYAHYHPSKPGGIRAFLMRRYMRRTIQHFRQLGAGPGKRVLDIGCSAGEKLSILSNALGVEPVGVEPNETAAQSARDAYGIEVHNTTFPHAAIEPGSVDFVYINHVIEHVPDPVGLLDAIHTVLKPGGYVIGETESIDCLSFRFFQRYWSLLHVPYHLLFFTGDTLRTVFERSRFGDSPIEIKSLPDPTAWSLSTQNYLRRHRTGKPATARMRGYLLLSLACVPVSWIERGRGPILRFHAQKGSV